MPFNPKITLLGIYPMGILVYMYNVILFYLLLLHENGNKYVSMLNKQLQCPFNGILCSLKKNKEAFNILKWNEL